MGDVEALGLSASQLDHARTIVAAVRRREWLPKAAVIALETALVESNLRNYANANVPASLTTPHEAVGYDHASLGVFQQQTGTAWANPGTTTMGTPNGWGTPAELMDVNLAAVKFLDALAHLDWQSMTTGAAAQRVQGSAFPDRYQMRDTEAARIVAALWTEDDMPAPKDWDDADWALVDAHVNQVVATRNAIQSRWLRVMVRNAFGAYVTTKARGWFNAVNAPALVKALTKGKKR